MAYVDSNVFLYPVLYHVEVQPKVKKAKEILFRIESGALSAFTSTLTWDEVVWVVGKVMSRNEGVAQGQKLLGFPNLEFINVDEGVLTQAQTLMNKYKLSPRDSIHAASALGRRIKTAKSADEEFSQIKQQKKNRL